MTFPRVKEFHLTFYSSGNSDCTGSSDRSDCSNSSEVLKEMSARTEMTVNIIMKKYYFIVKRKEKKETINV